MLRIEFFAVSGFAVLRINLLCLAVIDDMRFEFCDLLHTGLGLLDLAGHFVKPAVAAKRPVVVSVPCVCFQLP